MKELNLAYDVLKNDEKRNFYNKTGCMDHNEYTYKQYKKDNEM